MGIHGGAHKPTGYPILQIGDGLAGVGQQVIDHGFDVVVKGVQTVGGESVDRPGALPMATAAFDADGQAAKYDRPDQPVGGPSDFDQLRLHGGVDSGSERPSAGQLSQLVCRVRRIPSNPNARRD
jgi:hypothetical protein